MQLMREVIKFGFSYLVFLLLFDCFRIKQFQSEQKSFPILLAAFVCPFTKEIENWIKVFVVRKVYATLKLWHIGVIEAFNQY